MTERQRDSRWELARLEIGRRCGLGRAQVRLWQSPGACETRRARTRVARDAGRVGQSQSQVPSSERGGRGTEVAEGRRLRRDDGVDFVASRIPARIRIHEFVDSGTLEFANFRWNLAGRWDGGFSG